MRVVGWKENIEDENSVCIGSVDLQTVKEREREREKEREK
jgi:hypothetical protein